MVGMTHTTQNLWHYEQVMSVFNRKTEGTNYPFPRPVRGCSMDFAILYHGTHLLDGECKSKENEGHQALLFYLTQQLAWKDLYCHCCHHQEV